MKLAFVFLSLLGAAPLFAADKMGQLIFQDDFARNESQEKTDEPGNGWSTNSKSRAKGNKQVDLRDGAMYISTHAEANHAASVTHPMEFRDGAVAVRFKLEDARDRLGVNFADPECKEVHAGHLCAVRIDPTKVIFQDLKTGNMRLDIHTARTAKQKLTEEQEQARKGKEKPMPHALEVGKWHDLLIEIVGEEMKVTLDGKVVGSFRSPGIGHPTKRMLRLPTLRNVVIDDIKVWRRK